MSKSFAVRTSEPRNHTKRTKVIVGHAIAVRDDIAGSQRDHRLYNKKIIEKEFGADDKDGKEAVQWKNRVKDWYNAERRFIFATKTEHQRQRWLDEIMKEKACSAITKARASVVSEKKLGHSPASGNKVLEAQTSKTGSRENLETATQLLDLTWKPSALTAVSSAKSQTTVKVNYTSGIGVSSPPATIKELVNEGPKRKKQTW